MLSRGYFSVKKKKGGSGWQEEEEVLKNEDI